MRNMLVAALAFGMAMTLSLTASAGALDAGNSFLDIKLGSVPMIRISAASTDVTLTNVSGTGTTAVHGIDESASVFQTDSFTVQSAAFTGLPALTGLKLTLHAGTGDFDSSATYANPVGLGTVSGFGGLEANTGVAILQATGFDFTIPLTPLGSGGSTSLAAVLANTLVVTGAPFNTGAVNITGLSSNIVHVPSLNTTGVAFTLNLTTVQLLSAYELTANGVILENSTAIIGGANNLASASQAGSIKMVSPYRIRTGNLAGNVAGSVTKTFTFVPEPGTVLLLLTGAAGLAVVGRSRMRK
ncbi:MAG: PEP-CTERM sorting domain-containing protein [bacterium]|nr:PEP-CTERM sorting domain-containing protein [bacterium]MCP5041112.1 PEP-CTERM sorting domain-containing protein [bacterium]